MKEKYPEAYQEYLKNAGQAEGLAKADKKHWYDYYKNNLMHNEYKVNNYPNIKFNRLNFKKDYSHNLPNYENMPEQLYNSNYAFTTNYKNEKDRIYDHLLNVNGKDVKDFLSEVIPNAGKKSLHNYKMMKHLNKTTLMEMSEYLTLPTIVEEIPFGKYKGSLIIDVLETDSQYLRWITREASLKTKYPDLIYTINKLLTSDIEYKKTLDRQTYNPVNID
jgi:uncharacterized protein (DUF3820 family)